MRHKQQLQNTGVSRGAAQYESEIRESGQSKVLLRRCQIKVDQKYEAVSELTYKWFHHMRDKHGDIHLSMSIICKNAHLFAVVMECSDFKDS